MHKQLLARSCSRHHGQKAHSIKASIPQSSLNPQLAVRRPKIFNTETRENAQATISGRIRLVNGSTQRTNSPIIKASAMKAAESPLGGTCNLQLTYSTLGVWRKHNKQTNTVVAARRDTEARAPAPKRTWIMAVRIIVDVRVDASPCFVYKNILLYFWRFKA